MIWFLTVVLPACVIVFLLTLFKIEKRLTNGQDIMQ